MNGSTPERRMWAAVALAALDDFNRDYCKAVRAGHGVDRVEAAVRRYFTGRDGLEVQSRAGITIDADAAVKAISLPRRKFKGRQTVGMEPWDNLRASA